jgi:tRNA-specific 2-thiouridylase
LGIPFYVWDLAERFRADVVDNFVAEYAAGRTPNPCLRCNEKIKFSAVLDRALALGFDAVGTGHYARIVDTPSGRELHRAVDSEKDQSYVLGVLTGDQLAHAIFPLGPTVKADVRAEAQRRGLAVARKPDSHDICFIADGDTAGFLRGQLGQAPGEVVDVNGDVIGEHDGTYGFTIGQRRGLHIDTPADDGRPRYVLSISPVDRRVTAGPREALAIDEVAGVAPRWCGQEPMGAGRYSVQFRAHGVPVGATTEIDADVIRVRFDTPQEGVAPGQAIVLYDGDRVLGSATIDTTAKAMSGSGSPADVCP